MNTDYIKLGAPVINHRDLRRAVLALPTRAQCNIETKSDTCSIFLDGNQETFIMFDWDEKENGWRLRNRVIFDPITNPMFPCTNCQILVKHIINKNVTKKKCMKCETVTDLLV